MLAFYYFIPNALSLFFASSSIVLLGIVHFIERKRHKKSFTFGLIVCLTTISFGSLFTNLHNEKRHDTHYLKLATTEQPITFRIKSLLKPSLYSEKYIIDILNIGDRTAYGKALLNVAKSDSTSRLDVDNIYTTKTALNPIQNPLNPNQFDYKAYLEKQYIYKQLYTTTPQLFLISTEKHTIYGYADAIRKHINSSLNTYHFSADELSIINALILGQRQDISKDITTHYINAGAIHILAVSGLHVGLILYLLTFLFKPLHRFKNGKLIAGIIIIILLWCFAIIAGLSSSVTRAVTMFSIVAFAMHSKRPTNIYNTLAFSILILVLCKPLILFDVGFQLSYLAVIAIVSIQPLLANLWTPKYYIPKKLWDVFTVTLAAQFGVLPISLFYFHQIPGLFFIANLLIIPFLGVILGLGILVIALASVALLPQFLADFYGGIIGLMNTLMAWISQHDAFLLKGISFSLLQVLSGYLIIVFLIGYFKNSTYKWLRLTFISIVVFYGVLIYSEFESSDSSFTVFHKSRYTILGKKENKALNIASNLDSIDHFRSLESYVTEQRIGSTRFDTLQSLYSYNDRYVLLIDSLGVYNITNLNPDYIILINSPKINLNRLLKTLQPKAIIADGSNYKSYVARWKTTCLKTRIPFHSTYEKGAFIMEY
ncbi:ComEC/Rec2 family competence protein [Bizionia gelidisalsuginis]|uniref:ComEC/Rec2 family competence protein n=1 Tax=Bizionia gelidisalsuginis TaxID=291188 RepID=UPI001FE7AA12|nr:ComEC/Rec2 family competence protein [Bizionia gelidisalsuginis]